MEWPNRISRFGKGLRPEEGPAATSSFLLRRDACKCHQAFTNILNSRTWAGHMFNGICLSGKFVPGAYNL